MVAERFLQYDPWQIWTVRVLVGVGALALVAAGWVLSLAMTESPTPVVASVGGILLAATVFISPRVGFYVLIASAMFNRFDVFVGVHLRPDQIVLVPVLAGIAPRLAMGSVNFLSRPNQRLRVPTLSAIVFGELILYVAINLLSSYLFSPEFWESFQIVGWFVLSFMAFAAAYLLIGRYVGPREAFFALLASGFVSGAIGVVFFALFKLTGSMVGIQPPDVATEPVKAAGTFLEANLFRQLPGVPRSSPRWPCSARVRR